MSYLRFQRSLFEKVVQLNEKIAEKVLWRYLGIVYELEPSKDLFWPPRLRDQFDIGGQSSLLKKLGN